MECKREWVKIDFRLQFTEQCISREISKFSWLRSWQFCATFQLALFFKWLSRLSFGSFRPFKSNALLRILRRILKCRPLYSDLRESRPTRKRSETNENCCMNVALTPDWLSNGMSNRMSTNPLIFQKKQIALDCVVEKKRIVIVCFWAHDCSSRTLVMKFAKCPYSS